MQIGSQLSGLSLLLPLALVSWVFAVRAVAVRWLRAPNGFGTWITSAAVGYILYLLNGLTAAEVLGLFNALTRVPLLCWWLVSLVATSVAAFVFRPTVARGRAKMTVRSSLSVVLPVVLFLMLLVFLFWLGTVAAPNNQDAMNYHLTRAAVWATNHNVNNYPTNISKQLYNGRLAEYFTTQSLILDGSDRFVFIPQFLAYAMSSLLVAGLARQMAGTRRAGIWVSSWPPRFPWPSCSRRRRRRTLWWLPLS